MLPTRSARRRSLKPFYRTIDLTLSPVGASQSLNLMVPTSLHCFDWPSQLTISASESSRKRNEGGNNVAALALLNSLIAAGYLLIVFAAAVQVASSCEPVPPEQPIAPISLPPSTNGIPPREAMTSSSVRM